MTRLVTSREFWEEIPIFRIGKRCRMTSIVPQRETSRFVVVQKPQELSSASLRSFGHRECNRIDQNAPPAKYFTQQPAIGLCMPALERVNQCAPGCSKAHCVRTHLKSIIPAFVSEVTFVLGIKHPTLSSTLKQNIRNHQSIWIVLTIRIVPWSNPIF